MDDDRTWTPQKICAIFGLARTTLFNYEKQGIISPPLRKEGQERLYTAKHRNQIAAYLNRRNYERALKAQKQPDGRARLEQVTEGISLRKFADQGNILGLYELDERRTLEPGTLQRLAQIAGELEPSNPLFAQVIATIYRKLPQQETSQS